MPMTYDLNLREYWRTIRRRKFIIIFTTVVMTLFSLMFAVLGRPIPIYKTSASIKVEKSGSLTGLYIKAVSWSTTNYMETQMAMIKSYLIMEMVAKKLDLIPPDLSSTDIRSNPRYLSSILYLKDHIETEQDGNSDIINITASSQDPVRAQRLANTVAQVYKEYHTLDLNRRIIESKKYIETQVVAMREKLQNAEDAVRDFREAHRMVSLDAQSASLVSQISTLRVAYDRDQATYDKIVDVENDLNRAEERPLTSKSSFYFDEASLPYKNLNERLVQLMLERDILLINYTDSFPQLIEIRKKIHEIVTSMKAQLHAQKVSLSQNIALNRKQLQHYDSELKTLPTLGLELARLEREVAVNREIYTMLEKQYQEALIQNAEKIEEVEIVKPALEPTTPVNPPKTGATTGLGFMLGLILGVVFAFLIETFDTSIGAVEDVEEFLGVRVLGIIPHIDFEEVRLTIKENTGGDVDDDRMWRISRMISHFAPKTTAAESYRALRTNINFARLERDIKTIVLTSSSPQEGKTTISINLAIAIAQAGNKVLLIDGDLRRPVISKIFGIPSQPGITDVILGNFEWHQVVRSITDVMTGKMAIDEIMLTPGLDNLSIMTCGTIAPNPAELVGTKAIGDILKQANAEYDLVIIDAPPILAATDATIWGTRSDGVIIVYQVGKVARGALKRAKAQIDNVKARIIGVVLNGLKAEISPDYEYHDKYYYYYGSERKRMLNTSERIAAWFEEIMKSSQDLPRAWHRFRDAYRIPDVNFKSTLRWIILLLACGLLFAGLYFSGFLKNVHAQTPLRSDTSSSETIRHATSHAAGNPEAAATQRYVSIEAAIDPHARLAISEYSPPTATDVASLSFASTSNPGIDRNAVQIAPSADQRSGNSLIARPVEQNPYFPIQAVELNNQDTWHRALTKPFAFANDARHDIDHREFVDICPVSLVRPVASARYRRGPARLNILLTHDPVNYAPHQT